MKTFDEKDLITWSNRNKAEIGRKYYFAHTLTGLQKCIENSSYIETLAEIDDDDINSPFNYHDKEGYICNFACILPTDAVKDTEPKKKKNYRPCKTIKEFYEVINNYGSDSFPNKYFRDENFMYNLLDTTIHFRSRSTYVEYFSNIVSICKRDNTGIRVLFRGKSYLSFEQIFTSYEIELNGKWLPFGVLDED